VDAVSGPFAEATVGLFPGQGSISGGAGGPWRQLAAWDVVDEVADASGVDVARLLLDTDTDDLVRTDRAQMATFALSLVGWRHYRSQLPAPRRLAGHSLGEVSALVAAGVLSVADGARLVAARGTAMLEASQLRPGTMVALMGGSEGALGAIAALDDLWVANVNGPDQIVVSGTAESVADLLARSRELGWRRATPLSVGGAFHSPLMAPAQAGLDRALADVEFGPSEHLIAANADGAWHDGGEQWRALLSRQLTAPVQFLALVSALPDSVTEVVEMPPAGVLVGLAKRIRPFASILPLDAPPTD
jgi:[acyl-carrier-protein] S-malonyltransferase